jgi:sulfur carrier protein
MNVPAYGADSEKEAEVLSFEDGVRPGPDFLDLVVQGKQIHYHGARDVRSLLESQGENSVYANVRINGEVLGRRDFENIALNDGDNVDFLYYMGGGRA